MDLQSLPVDLVVDHLLPACSVQALVSLASTSKSWRRLITTCDALWRRRISKDFNFPLHSTARSTGWYELYKQATNPEVYVWGQAANGRLGLARSDPAYRRIVDGGLPEPHRLRFGHKVVDIVCGGWSFHALTQDGRVLFWGTLNGDGWAPPQASFDDPSREQPTPRMLDADFPAKITALSAGRSHMIATDSDGNVYTWHCWGKIARLQPTSHRFGQVTAVEAGWTFSAVLCRPEASQKQRSVFVMHAPSRRQVQSASSAATQRRALQSSEGYEVDSVLFDLPVEGLHLPPIPDLEDKEDIKQIGAGDHFVIALTTMGRLFKLDISPMQRQNNAQPADEDDHEGLGPADRERLANAFLNGERAWVYLRAFCDMACISQHAVYGEHPELVKPDSKCRISAISAHFLTFVAYGVSSNAADSLVLLGDGNSSSASMARIIPELQGKGVIKVAQGDYHYGALTSDGQLLTWGKYSSGALGHGRGNSNVQTGSHNTSTTDVDPPAPTPAPRPQPGSIFRRGQIQRPHLPDLQVPIGVDFQANITSPHRKFIFNIAMAGWHSAALAIDLDREDGESDSESEPETRMPGSFTHNHSSPPENNTTNHFEGRIFRPRGIRLGYPARGIRRGPMH